MNEAGQEQCGKERGLENAWFLNALESLCQSNDIKLEATVYCFCVRCVRYNSSPALDIASLHCSEAGHGMGTRGQGNMTCPHFTFIHTKLMLLTG